MVGFAPLIARRPRVARALPPAARIASFAPRCSSPFRSRCGRRLVLFPAAPPRLIPSLGIGTPSVSPATTPAPSRASASTRTRRCRACTSAGACSSAWPATGRPRSRAARGLFRRPSGRDGRDRDRHGEPLLRRLDRGRGGSALRNRCRRSVASSRLRAARRPDTATATGWRILARKEARMSQVAPQLVGRPVELGVFDDVLAQLADGRSGAIEVVGEPGIGKTRLLDELAGHADADARGSSSFKARRRSSSATCRSGCSSTRWTSTSGRSTRAQLETLDLQDARAELAHVFASFPTAAVRSAPLASSDERYRTHRAVRELLEPVGATSRWSSSSTTCTGPIRGVDRAARCTAAATAACADASRHGHAAAPGVGAARRRLRTSAPRRQTRPARARP